MIMESRIGKFILGSVIGIATQLIIIHYIKWLYKNKLNNG